MIDRLNCSMWKLLVFVVLLNLPQTNDARQFLSKIGSVLKSGESPNQNQQSKQHHTQHHKQDTLHTGGKHHRPDERTHAKLVTRDLCDKDVTRASPQSSDFDIKCASCVSSSWDMGQKCVENTWTYVSLCQCRDYAFTDCFCSQTLGVLGWITYLIFPFIFLVIGTIVAICAYQPFCPVYQANLMRRKRRLQH